MKPSLRIIRGRNESHESCLILQPSLKRRLCTTESPGARASAEKTAADAALEREVGIFLEELRHSEDAMTYLNVMV